MVIYNSVSTEGDPGNVDITLPIEPLCGTAPVTGSNPMSSKYFRIHNADVDIIAGAEADYLTLHPGSGDIIFYNGTGCTSSPYTLTCESNPATIDVYGFDTGGSDYWIVMPIVGTCACD